MKQKKEGLSRLTIEAPEDLHRRLKVKAAEEGRKIRELVVEALERLLAQKPKKGEGKNAR